MSNLAAVTTEARGSQNSGVTQGTAQSPLHHRSLDKRVTTDTKSAGVVVRERAFLGHLNLRGNPQDATFMNGVKQALGLDLPTVPSSLVSRDSCTAIWLSPNEWLLLVPAGEEAATEASLREALIGQHISVIDVSGGQTVLNLSGNKVGMVLKKSCVYDFHPNNFGPGKAVQTTFAKAGATLISLEDGSVDMIIRRSFADYVWLWLEDASQEYGFAVGK
jgi:sarcosine oxidase subunit gamma